MSWKLRLFISGLAGATILAACNSGGFTAPPGTQCIANYQYLNTVYVPANQKVILDAAQNQAQRGVGGMPAGNYVYVGSSLFYTQTTPHIANPFVVDLFDTGSTATSPEVSGRTCVLNAAPKLSGISTQVYFPSSITIDSNLNQTINFRQFKMAVDNGLIAMVVSEEDPTKKTTNLAAPGGIPDPGLANVKLSLSTDPINNPNPIIYKTTDIDYQFVAQYDYQAPGDPNTYTFFVASHMIWQQVPSGPP